MFFVTKIEPCISGIYAGDLSQLSIKACFPEFIKYEKIYGSLLRGIIIKKKTHIQDFLAYNTE